MLVVGWEGLNNRIYRQVTEYIICISTIDKFFRIERSNKVYVYVIQL